MERKKEKKKRDPLTRFFFRSKKKTSKTKSKQKTLHFPSSLFYFFSVSLLLLFSFHCHLIDRKNKKIFKNTDQSALQARINVCFSSFLFCFYDLPFCTDDLDIFCFETFFCGKADNCVVHGNLVSFLQQKCETCV